MNTKTNTLAAAPLAGGQATRTASLAQRAMAWAKGRGTGAAAAAAGPKTNTQTNSVSATAVRSFELAADGVISRQQRQRAQWITRVAGLVVCVLLVWAALAQIDEVTKGDAKVISSKQLQQVQSLDGGVVSAIMVREGQVVEAGQVLLKIDETRATSGARENAAQGFALQARLARLRALAEGSEFKPPAHEGPEEARILEEERSLYGSRKIELANQQAISQQQLAQRQQELSEVRARRSAAERALASAQQELTRTRPLLASGAVSEVDIIKLDRDVSRNRGEVEQTSAQIMRAQASIGEAQRKLQETELSFRNEARKELAENMGRLNALNESAVALNDKVDKSQLKSPVRGRVQRLLANTVGGVVQAGKDLVEIVPLDDKLVLEAKVNPRDIAFIRPGQAANVKFTAYDSSIYGGLEAEVENISPDTVVDERGNAYYLVRVQTKKSQLGESMPIIPGMTAEVDVLTGKKSVLSYLLKPVLKVQQNALRER
jgi:adhesin transport system membrane fusion protein